MHPGEVFRHQPRLVALQRADEMPLQLKVGKRLDLADTFLHVVFAKSALPCGCRFAHRTGGPSLADGQQGGCTRFAPGFPGGVGDACENGLQLVGNCSHNQGFPGGRKYSIAPGQP